MGQLSPTQLILWILMLEVLSVPVVAFLSSWIINMIYTKKSELTLEIAKAITDALKDGKKNEQDNKM